jgi:hypothetical protein
MSGSNFYISHKQLVQSEAKIRITMLIGYSELSMSEIQAVDFTPTIEYSPTLEDVHLFSEAIIVGSMNLEPNELNVILFTGGYCARKLVKRFTCNDCTSLLQASQCTLPEADFESSNSSMSSRSLFNSVNRGKLTCPSDDVYLLCVVCYYSFSCIKRHEQFYSKFLSSPSSSNYFSCIVNEVLSSSTTYSELFSQSCMSGHSQESAKSVIVKTFFNILANGFVKDADSRTLTHSRDKQKIVKLSSQK